MNELTIASFQPDVFIEITDPFTGGRKMARVTEAGNSYTDLDDVGETPFPIYEHLQPAEVGNILGWGLFLVDQHPDEAKPFQDLVDRLIASGRDVLTYNRAAHWAFRNHNYDFERALAAGDEATAAVRAGRAKMDGIIERSGVLQ